MESLGIGSVAAGGFIFGIGTGIVPFATVGVIAMALGPVALFWNQFLWEGRGKVMGVTPEANRPKHKRYYKPISGKETVSFL